ncbi:hypothetical protein AALB39_21225 [Lachnospiraceae bacterium 54-53]
MKELTKNADKFICYSYKYHLEQLQNGGSIAQSKIISFDTAISFKDFYKLHPEDVKEIISEAARAGYGEMTMEGNFFIDDQMIVYMENRFKNGLMEVLDTVSKFIP